MLYQFPLVALALGFTPIAQGGPTFPRQATAGAFDCGQVRVDSPKTTLSGFIAADLDSERRYVVTKTANQKRLLTRFENNTLFTLVGYSLAWEAGWKNSLAFHDIEQQRQESNLWSHLWILLGHTTRQAQFRGFGAKLCVLQQRCRVQTR
jgi:hypothetical protein